MFPSPLGVSYFQILIFALFIGWVFMFPSPLGVSYFQITVIKSANVDCHSFPSPLGVSYFQILFRNRRIEFSGSRFRPLSGYLISKCAYNVVIPAT